eukprot:scaffold126661_cov28-Tisochrysis_lutea.AAC.17
MPSSPTLTTAIRYHAVVAGNLVPAGSSAVPGDTERGSVPTTSATKCQPRRVGQPSGNRLKPSGELRSIVCSASACVSSSAAKAASTVFHRFSAATISSGAGRHMSCASSAGAEAVRTRKPSRSTCSASWHALPTAVPNGSMNWPRKPELRQMGIASLPSAGNSASRLRA